MSYLASVPPGCCLTWLLSHSPGCCPTHLVAVSPGCCLTHLVAVSPGCCLTHLAAVSPGCCLTWLLSELVSNYSQPCLAGASSRPWRRSMGIPGHRETHPAVAGLGLKHGEGSPPRGVRAFLDQQTAAQVYVCRFSGSGDRLSHRPGRTSVRSACKGC